MLVIHDSKKLVRLMELRAVENNWTKNQLLYHFKITGSSFCRMKNGMQVPSLDTYVRLCDKLGLKLREEKKKMKPLPEPEPLRKARNK